MRLDAALAEGPGHAGRYDALLDHLDRDHGGARVWLQTGGMEQFELDLLRRRLIDQDT